MDAPAAESCKGELIPGATGRKGKPVCDWDGCADPDCCGQPECKLCQVLHAIPLGTKFAALDGGPGFEPQ